MSAPPSTVGRVSAPGVVLVGASMVAVLAQCYGLYRPEAPPTPAWLPYADKIGHLIGFAVPVALVLVVVARLTGTLSRTALLLIIGAFVAQGVLSEVVQATWFPNRSADPADLVADLVGIGLGVMLFRLTRRGRSA